MFAYFISTTKNWLAILTTLVVYFCTYIIASWQILKMKFKAQNIRFVCEWLLYFMYIISHCYSTTQSYL